MVAEDTVAVITHHADMAAVAITIHADTEMVVTIITDTIIMVPTIELAHHQESGRALRDESCDSDRRGVGAMRRAEAVVHIDLFVARQFMREVAIVGFLFFVEAQIFEQDRIARLERLDHFAGVIANAVGRKRYLLPERLG